MKRFLILLLTACASAPKEEAAKPAMPVQQVAPLAGMASKPVIVLPVQYLAGAAGMSSIEDRKSYLGRLDSLIADTLSNRGLRSTWTFAPAIARQAKRNSMVMPDVYGLAAERLKAAKIQNDQLKEPLASQVRSIIALSSARYVLLPVELNMGEPTTLRIALLDARLSRIVWIGNVSTPNSGTALAEIAAKFANLIIEP